MPSLCNLSYTSGIKEFQSRLKQKIKESQFGYPEVKIKFIGECLVFEVQKDLDCLSGEVIRAYRQNMDSWLQVNVKQYHKCNFEIFKNQNYFTIEFDL